MVIVWQSLKKCLGCDGLLLFPFIILDKKEHADNKQIMNHERIHVKQALELLILPFYLAYFLEFMVRRLSSKSKFEAYRKISFEKEAYANDEDPNYLKKRQPYSFAKYL